MKNTDPNEPASPFHLKPIPAFFTPGAEGETAEIRDFPGFTKRERIALLLHAKIIGAAAFNQPAEDMMLKAGLKTSDITPFLAHLAVDAADALIEALNQ